jgi:hypothetical protein
VFFLYATSQPPPPPPPGLISENLFASIHLISVDSRVSKRNYITGPYRCYSNGPKLFFKTTNVTFIERTRDILQNFVAIIVLQSMLHKLAFCSLKRKQIVTKFFLNIFFIPDARKQFRCEVVGGLYFRSVHSTSRSSLRKFNFSHLHIGRIAGFRRVFALTFKIN